MKTPKLFKTHTLTFTVYPSGGYPGLDGEWVYPTPTTQVVEGSLQAFKKGKKTLILPDGFRTEDARLFYTKSDLPTKDEVNKTKAATTIIKGRVFTIFDKEDNTGFNLTADHYLYLLIRESPANGEGW